MFNTHTCTVAQLYEILFFIIYTFILVSLTRTTPIEKTCKQTNKQNAPSLQNKKHQTPHILSISVTPIYRAKQNLINKFPYIFNSCPFQNESLLFLWSKSAVWLSKKSTRYGHTQFPGSVWLWFLFFYLGLGGGGGGEEMCFSFNMIQKLTKQQSPVALYFKMSWLFHSFTHTHARKEFYLLLLWGQQNSYQFQVLSHSPWPAGAKQQDGCVHTANQAAGWLCAHSKPSSRMAVYTQQTKQQDSCVPLPAPPTQQAKYKVAAILSPFPPSACQTFVCQQRLMFAITSSIMVLPKACRVLNRNRAFSAMVKRQHVQMFSLRRKCFANYGQNARVDRSVISTSVVLILSMINRLTLKSAPLDFQSTLPTTS